MKNFLKVAIIGAIMMSTLTTFSTTTQTVDKIDKQATNIVDKTSNGLNKVYGDGTNAISTIYSDVKSLAPKVEATIKELAKGLKVGAESVWKILVKQQKVWSWCYLIGTILTGLSWVNFYYRFNKGSKNANDDDWLSSDVFMCLITFSISIVLSVLSIIHFEAMMTGFINPEFGAMRNIITIASQLK